MGLLLFSKRSGSSKFQVQQYSVYTKHYGNDWARAGGRTNESAFLLHIEPFFRKSKEFNSNWSNMQRSSNVYTSSKNNKLWHDFGVVNKRTGSTRIYLPASSSVIQTDGCSCKSCFFLFRKRGRLKPNGVEGTLCFFGTCTSSGQSFHVWASLV